MLILFRKLRLMPKVLMYRMRGLSARDYGGLWESYWGSVQGTGSSGEVLWDTEDEQEIRSVSRHRPQLNAVATHLEEISATVGIPVTIKGGIIQPAQRTIAFVITIDPSHRTNIPACRQLTAAIKEHYPCQAAGVDETNDILWLYKLAPDQNPMQNAFAIMTARGGHDETNH